MKPVSNCCLAEMRVAGGDGTQWHECVKCLCACDYVRPTVLEKIHELEQVASNNSDWFGCLVKDLSEILACERNAAAVIDAVKHLKA